MITIAPSLMCMDFSRAREQFAVMDQYVNLYHFDIMDGHFCKNMALTPSLLKSFRDATSTDIDVHLMTTNPSDWIEMCAKAGATYISPHAETINTEAFRTMHLIRDLGCKCGVVLNPATPFSYIESYIEYIDMLTIMTVDIGFAGQKFIDQMYAKIEQARDYREAHGLSYKIQIDGHCNRENYKQLAEAGADILIVGNAGLFGLDPDLDTAFKKMQRELAQCITDKAS